MTRIDYQLSAMTAAELGFEPVLVFPARIPNGSIQEIAALCRAIDGELAKGTYRRNMAILLSQVPS